MKIVEANKCGVLELGYAGEKNRTQVRFYYGDLAEEFPGGAVIIQVKRPGEETKYDLLPDLSEEGYAVWNVSEYDCGIKGFGECQFIYATNDNIAKQKVWKTHVDRSIEGENTTVPPDWESVEAGIYAYIAQAYSFLNETKQYVDTATDEAEQAASDAAKSAEDAEWQLERYNDLRVGITTLPETAAATASMDHTDPDAPVLELGIPQGRTGATPQIGIGIVNTGVSGSSASVTITGTPERPILNFSIPMGNHGDTALLADSYVVDTGRRPVYEYNSYCIYDDKVYRCVMPIDVPEEWTPEHWEECKVLNEVMRFFKSAGTDVEFDKTTQTLYLRNVDGNRVGDGTMIETGISGIQMYTTVDETGTQYLILADAEGNELARTEFTVSGGGGSTAYVCRLINGMESTRLSYPGGQQVLLRYAFNEFFGQEQTAVNAVSEIYTKTATSDYVLQRTDVIAQGNNSVDITNYLQSGTNYVKIQATGGESGLVKVLVYTIEVVDMGLTSSFDATNAYSSAISFMYRVTGRNIQKTMHFQIDDNPEWTRDIGTSHNVQLTEVINLAAYGHGDHVFKCWFVTEDGTRSSTLVYDIIFDGGQSTPIISSTFDMESVDYGNLVQVQYVVFTHGSDYTAEVGLDIYTLDENQQKVYFSRTTLVNVVNESVQNWNITQYPESGTAYLEITAGTAKKTFPIVINEITGGRDLDGVTARLIAAYSASGRNNSDAGRDALNASYTSTDDITTTINGALTGFNWRSNGWVSNEQGFPVLRISGGAEVNIDLPFFSAGWVDSANHQINLAGTPTRAGRTFEVAFSTSGVTDEDAEIITLFDEAAGIGIKIFPSKAYMLSNTMSVVTDSEGNVVNKNAIPYIPFSSAGKVRLSFVIEEQGHYVETITDETSGVTRTENKQLMNIYVNGERSRTVAYTTDDFTTSLAKPKMKAESCVLDIYSMRMYDSALDDSDVLKNYIADLPSISEKIEVYDENAIVNDGGDVDLDLARKQYPCMVLTGALSQYKGDKVKIGVLLYKPDSEDPEEYITEWDFMETDNNGNYGNVNNVQGTSSQYYIKKNYKITFYRWNEESGKFAKVKVAIMPGLIPVNTICIKADYMSPDSANTGNANFWQEVLSEPTPPQVEDERVQTSVKGYPMLVFQRDDAVAAPTFIGRYNLNNDKGNSGAFGLENDDDDGNVTKCQKWEYLDNSEDICGFLTDQLHAIRTDSDGGTYEAWEDALESCYPDQGDLEDEGLKPNLDHLQWVYTWLTQRANFLDASTNAGTGGTYNGVSYDTEYDLKLAIFRREFPKHFNMHHATHYFIANEVPLLVDNFKKNLFMTCYDVTADHVVDRYGNAVNLSSITRNGVVDASNVDWENSTFAIWYCTLYDLDSCLGADNNGFDQFPYYKEMWDTFNNGYIVNGHNSLLWRLFYAAFFNEIKALYHTFRDVDKTLTPALYTAAMIDDLTQKLPTVAVNADEKFKYVDAYEGGYYDRSANDGNGGWVYTGSFLYLVKGTMASYHRDFITKRMAMLDSKYMSDAYIQDYMTVRTNRGISTPDDLAFRVSPSQALYCYTEWGNSGSYIGGKCLEGESIEMKPTSSGNWYDIVVAIYGASHLKSLGDLSVIYPSKLINLARCVNLTELILGSEAAGYENTALDSVADVSYLKMLQKLNISNCTSLTGTVDLSPCDLIEEVYARGSNVGTVVLPQGGYLKKLYLPGSVTALNIVDHAGLTHFGMDSYANITRLRVENTPNVDTAGILAARGTNIQRLRLIGVNWNLQDDDVLWTLADSSMAGKAIDANGNNIADGTVYPTVTGTCHVAHIYPDLYETLQTLYPNLTVTYDTIYHFVRFYNEGVLHEAQKVDDGGNATNPTTVPVKQNTVQTAYLFSSWDGNMTNIVSDASVNAVFASSTQVYSIRLWNDREKTSLLETINSVVYDTSVFYTPTEEVPKRTGYVFCGWETSDGTVYVYEGQFPVSGAAITAYGQPEVIDLVPNWSEIAMPSTSKIFAGLTPGEQLFTAIAIQRGTTERYTVTYFANDLSYRIYDNVSNVELTVSVSDSKPWMLKDGSTFEQQILDFNHDYSDLAETHKLGITYGAKNIYSDPPKTIRSLNGLPFMYSYKFGENGQEHADCSNGHDARNTVEREQLAVTHTPTADEIASGYSDIYFTGPTFIEKIFVTHSDTTTTTWYFDVGGFYRGEDSTDYNTSGGYKTDFEDEDYYKISKMLINKAPSTYVNNSRFTAADLIRDQSQHFYVTDTVLSFPDFGGLIIDTTGANPDNTIENNPLRGSGKGILLHTQYYSSLGVITFISQGVKIRVPILTGDTVTVVGRGYSNANSFAPGFGILETEETIFCKTFSNLFPYGLKNIIVAASKRSLSYSLSGCITRKKHTLWPFGVVEMGTASNNLQYIGEGTVYPVFTDNASRKQFLDEEQKITTNAEWLLRSRSTGLATIVINSSGAQYNTWPNDLAKHRPTIGFCSGEVVDDESGSEEGA